MKSINILLPHVWTAVYYNVAKLLAHALSDLGFKCEIFEFQEQGKADLSIILGWHLLPDALIIKEPFILYQLEPLAIPLWKEKVEQKLELFKDALCTWDYSVENQQYYYKHELDFKVVNLGYHEKLFQVKRSDFPEFDVLFVGFITERRKKVLDELGQHCSVSIKPRWGEDYLDALGRAKIFLNIHQYDLPTPLEAPRIVSALNNNAFVVSEMSLENPYNGLVMSKMPYLVETVLENLNHPARRKELQYEQYNNFMKMPMSQILETSLSDIYSVL